MSEAKRVAIVTGASEGVGFAIASRLASDGYRVAMVSRTPEKIRVAADRIGGQAFGIADDIGDPAAAARIIFAVGQRFGRIDALVHSASTTRSAPIDDIGDDEWRVAFEVKVLGAMRLSREAWPELVRSRGSILAIGGIGAHTPTEKWSMTGPLTGSLIAFMKMFAERGIDQAVRVNMIHPGPVTTPRTMRAIEQRALAERRTVDEVMADQVRALGVQRLGTADDVAELASFVLSDRAGWLHGAGIDLDGGMTRGV